MNLLSIRSSYGGDYEVIFLEVTADYTINFNSRYPSDEILSYGNSLSYCISLLVF